MRVFVLGRTGPIGAPIVQELLRCGHHVCALARSVASAAKLSGIRGDADPRRYRHAAAMDRETSAGRRHHSCSLIHLVCDFVVCDFETEMARPTPACCEQMLRSFAVREKKPRFIYTGGCWLFGVAGNDIATEQTAFRPLPALAWIVPHLQRVLEATEVDGIVIHPAMAYTPELESSIVLPAMPSNAVRSAWSRANRCAGHWKTAKTLRCFTLWRWKMRRSD